MRAGGFFSSIVAQLTNRQLAFELFWLYGREDRSSGKISPVEPHRTAHPLTALLYRINVDERQLIRSASCVGKHLADNLRLFNATSRKTNGLRWRAFLAVLRREHKMDGYRVMQVGPGFIVFAGDVGVLKC
jgi:hypothetical protein